VWDGNTWAPDELLGAAILDLSQLSLEPEEPLQVGRQRRGWRGWQGWGAWLPGCLAAGQLAWRRSRGSVLWRRPRHLVPPAPQVSLALGRLHDARKRQRQLQQQHRQLQRQQQKAARRQEREVGRGAAGGCWGCWGLLPAGPLLLACCPTARC
jgi:hypothetical protein